VRLAGSPDDEVMRYFQETYEATAELAHWDRDALERDPPGGV
jgi:hypothetical protein